MFAGFRYVKDQLECSINYHRTNINLPKKKKHFYDCENSCPFHFVAIRDQNQMEFILTGGDYFLIHVDFSNILADRPL